VRVAHLVFVLCMLGCGSATGRSSGHLNKQGSAAVVQRQVEAYNAHDVEALLGTYSDSLTLQTLPDTTLVRGKDRLREGSKDWFSRAPRVHADILHRTVLGSFVVDQEHLTGTPDGAPLDAVAIYQVTDGRIQRVWFVPPGH
jgi:hypothetical protein